MSGLGSFRQIAEDPQTTALRHFVVDQVGECERGRHPAAAVCRDMKLGVRAVWRWLMQADEE